MEAEIRSGDGYIESGAGTPLVMLPGMEGSKWFWRHQVAEFADRFRAVSLDLPARPPTAGTTISDYASDLLGRLELLGIESMVLVGESMGGMIAQHITLEHPGRVLGLVLCNTMDRPRLPGLGLNMFTVATLVHQLAFLPFLPGSARRRLLAWVGRHRGFVLDPSPGNDELVSYLFEHGTECGPGAYLDRIFACRVANYTDRLGGIRVPTLVLRGTEDRLVTAATTLELLGRIPEAELALVEGGGHCCQHTCPGATNSVMASWLERKGFVS